jgi:NAD(P)H-nitrite reductase large subunit
MKPDDPVCLCFHVTRRKVVNFIRVEKPRRASQLSQCFGAGTGCGWCRPYLERLLEEANAGRSKEELKPNAFDEMTPQEYAQQRSKYVEDGGGTPPKNANPESK